MLVISRRRNESIRVGDDVVVKIGKVTGSVVKLIIEAPRSTPIVRAELLHNVRACQPLKHVLHDVSGTQPLRCHGSIG